MFEQKQYTIPESLLRDFFASQAIAGLMGVSSTYYDLPIGTCVEMAYKIADAMIKQREVKNEPNTKAI